MKMRGKTFLALLVVAACLVARADAAPPILVETFENPLVFPAKIFSADDLVGSWFTVGDTGSSVTLLNDPDHPGTAGRQVLAFGRVGDGGGEPVIRASLEGLTVGQTYRVSLDYSSLALPQDSGRWSIRIGVEMGFDDLTIARVEGTHFTVGGLTSWYGTEDNPWRELVGEFVAPAEMVTLFISAYARAYPVIDNVRVVAVPEPGTMALFGFTVLVTARRFVRRISG